MWTEDEVELCLNITLKYKVNKRKTKKLTSNKRENLKNWFPVLHMETEFFLNLHPQKSFPKALFIDLQIL